MTLPKDVDKNHHFKQQMKAIKEREKKFKELKEIELKPKGPLFKLKKFEQQQSVIKCALDKNDLDSINCCYTAAGHANNAAECERMILDKMGPASNYPKNAILSLAARSVISKKDREIMEEESKLLKDYYQDFYQDPMKGSSSRSHESPNHTKGENKSKIETHLNSKIIEQNVLNRNSMDNIRKYNNDSNDLRNSVPNVNIKSLKEADATQKLLMNNAKPKEMSEEELGETLAKLELKRKSITAMIYRLPIANRYLAVIQREKELYLELDQINEAIEQLSHNKVFVM